MRPSFCPGKRNGAAMWLDYKNQPLGMQAEGALPRLVPLGPPVKMRFVTPALTCPGKRMSRQCHATDSLLYIRKGGGITITESRAHAAQGRSRLQDRCAARRPDSSHYRRIALYRPRYRIPFRTLG